MSPSKPHSTSANTGGPLPPKGADRATVRFVNDQATSDAVQAAVVDAMERHDYSKASRFAVRLALAEGIANAFHHGHQSLPATTPITVEFAVNGRAVKIEIEDQGPGFDPGMIADPTLDENLEVPSGRGLMLIRAYMTKVSHNAKGNRVVMVYEKPVG